jgi:WD40 repeat protein/DNA-binding SARP family transcriptional activator
MAQLRLSVLKTFQATLAGAPIVGFRSTKTQALLAYLAVEADWPHRREILAGLLWPDYPERAAQHNLSQSLLNLRQVLGDAIASSPFFLPTRQTVQFNPASEHWLDLDELTAHLAASQAHAHPDPLRCEFCMHQLAQAIELYRAPFLAEFSLAGSNLFEEWALIKREWLHRQMLEALNRLIDYCERLADHAGAERYARRLVELDPFRESAHRQLMRALALGGQHGAALAQYEACQHILAAELDAAPAAETTALYEQIRTNQLRMKNEELNTPGQAAPQFSILNSQFQDAPDLGSFYGRAAELVLLQRWLVADRCRVVMLLGIGGVGKTALAARVAGAVRERFERVIWRSLLNAPPLGELLHSCIQALSAQDDAKVPASQDAQLDLLLSQLRRRRCLLVLDNLESILQAGEHTGRYRPGYDDYRQLLERIGHSGHASCLLLTSRERPLELGRLEGDQLPVRALKLAGLDADAGHSILRERGLGDQLAGHTALVERYSGNPLALKLVATTIHDLFAGDIAAFLRHETPIFDDVRTMLDQQLARLSAQERELLIWLAIEREPTTIAALQANLVRREPPRAVLEALRSLQRRSLIEQHGDGSTLQNVVMEYTTDLLITQVLRELESEQLDLFVRHALAKAQAKEYLRQTQVRLILAPVAQQLSAQLGAPSLDALFHRLLRQLRSTPRAPGYAAGNLLNLLLHLDIDPQGYDFSNLCVWQVYARGRRLPELSLAYADLKGSVFTDSFHAMHAIAWSPDGARLAMGASDGAVFVWRVADGVLLNTFPMSSGFVWTLDWAGDFIACGGDVASIAIWNVEQGLLVRSLPGHGSWINHLAFSPDGTLLATCGGDFTIHVWHVPTWQLLYTLHGHTDIVDCITWSPDSTRLASASVDQTIRLWDVQGEMLLQTLPSPTPRLKRIAWKPDGTLLAGCAPGRPLYLWDAQTGELLDMLGDAAGFGELAWSPDNRRLASEGADLVLHIWDAQTRELSLAAPQDALSGNMAWSRNGATLAIPYANSTVRLWDERTGRILSIFYGYTSWIYSVAWSPDSASVAAATHAHQIQLWEAQNGRPCRTLSGHAGWVLSIAWSPDGTRLASGGADSTVRVWDVLGGQALPVVGRHAGLVEAVCWSPDGTRLASGGRDRVVRVWDIRDGRPIHLLSGHTDTVLSVAWSPDGTLLASGGRDRIVRVWELASGRERIRFEAHQDVVPCVAWSPDGARLASTSNDGSVCIVNLDTGVILHTLRGHSGQVKAVTWRPDGRALASGSNDATVRIWDSTTGECLRVLHGHSQWIKSVAWSPDGVHLATGSYDETLRLWQSDTGECIAVLHPPGPYTGTNIAGATGLTEAQRAALKALGAVETSSSRR